MMDIQISGNRLVYRASDNDGKLVIENQAASWRFVLPFCKPYAFTSRPDSCAPTSPGSTQQMAFAGR